MQNGSGTPMDIRQRSQQPQYPRNRLRAAQEEFRKIAMEAGVPRRNRYPANAKNGA